jgi:hypothetical protein
LRINWLIVGITRPLSLQNPFGLAAKQSENRRLSTHRIAATRKTNRALKADEASGAMLAEDHGKPAIVLHAQPGFRPVSMIVRR